MSGFLYLASPYSNPDAAVRESRYHAACRVAARMMAEGRAVFSPIAHSHPIALYLPPELGCDFDFWMAQDLPILAAASSMSVLRLDGWEMSRGIRREMEFAASRGIPMEYIDP